MTSTAKPVDPLAGGGSDFGTFEDVQEDLQLRMAQLDEALAELHKINESSAQVEFDYEREFLLAHLATDPEETVGMRQSIAKAKCLEQWRDHLRAKAKLSAAKMAINVRDSLLSAAQTRAKLLMTQFELETKGPR